MFFRVTKRGEVDVKPLDFPVDARFGRDGSGPSGDATPARRDLAWNQRFSRILGTVLVALCMIIAGAAVLVGRLTTVRPPYAAVASDTLSIRAPVGGVVVWVSPARQVAPGDAVATVSTYRSHETATQLDQAVALGEQNLKSKADAARDVHKTFGTYRQASSMDVQMGKATEQSVGEQMRLQADRVERISSLSAAGFVSRDTMDMEKSKLAGLKVQLLEARRVVKEAELARASAAQGFYLNQGRTTQTSVLDARRELAGAAQDLQRLKSLRSAALPIERIEAPCRCTIGSRRVQLGEYVNEGQLLILLNKQVAGSGPAALRVEAVVPLDQISKVDVGSSATIMLPGSTERYQGKVSSITYDLTMASAGGLPKQVLELGGVALVVVTLPTASGLRPMENGTPVKLELHAGLLSALGL